MSLNKRHRQLHVVAVWFLEYCGTVEHLCYGVEPFPRILLTSINISEAKCRTVSGVASSVTWLQ